MTRTKGNVIIEDIKIGDTHYEFEYGMKITSRVISLPVEEKREDNSYWNWQSETEDGKVINYSVSSKYSHYGPNLYDYEAYKGCKEL